RCARRGFCPAYFLAAGYRIPPYLCIPLGSHSNRSIRRTVTYRWDYAWQLPTWRLRAHAYLGGRTLERRLGRPRYCGCHLGFNLCTPTSRKTWHIRSLALAPACHSPIDFARALRNRTGSRLSWLLA